MSNRRRESGQAAVESALTLPLVLFMILGTMQLFLALQARILAQNAIARGVRQGSLHHANCDVIRGAAVAVLIPAIAPFAKPGTSSNTKTNRLASLLGLLKNGTQFTYRNLGMPNYTGDVIWLERTRPTMNDINGKNIEDEWDLPPPQGTRYDLAVRMIFWYPMRIPFANWVIARAVLAAQGLQSYGNQNPYLLTQKANWNTQGNGPPIAAVGAEFLARTNRKEYVLPIQASAAMRMMTPPRAAYLSAVCSF